MASALEIVGRLTAECIRGLPLSWVSYGYQATGDPTNPLCISSIPLRIHFLLHSCLMQLTTCLSPLQRCSVGLGYEMPQDLLLPIYARPRSVRCSTRDGHRHGRGSLPLQTVAPGGGFLEVSENSRGPATITLAGAVRTSHSSPLSHLFPHDPP